MKALFLIPVLFLFGCGAEQKFITLGSPANHPPVILSQILVYSDPSQVPWPYTAIGEIMPNRTPMRFQTPSVQIDDIKREAAKNGADAVILHKDMGQRGSAYMQNGSGFGQQPSVIVLSGTAIIKKVEVSTKSLTN